MDTKKSIKGALLLMNQEIKSWFEDIQGKVDYILVLPHNTEYLNNLFRSAFESKLGARRAVVVEGEQAERLLEWYSLYAFTDKLIIGSFCLPNGRKLHNLLSSGIATEEELINDVILGGM